MKISDIDRKKYGLKLKELREQKGLTQKEVVSKVEKFIQETYKGDENLCEKKSFNQNQLSNWENGKYLPHHINRFLLSVVYDVPAEELETCYTENIAEELEDYIQKLNQENEIYIDKDNMIFESEDEMKEIIGDLDNSEISEAFKNGTLIDKNYLGKLVVNQNWNIEEKIKYIIDLHMKLQLIVPKSLIEALNEKDPEKKAQMYYTYFVDFYNGSLWASKHRKSLK